MRTPALPQSPAAAKLPDQRLKHSHQPFRCAAFRQKIAREREDRDAGKQIIRREAVELQRHRFHRQIAPPKKNQRRAPNAVNTGAPSNVAIATIASAGISSDSGPTGSHVTTAAAQQRAAAPRPGRSMTQSRPRSAAARSTQIQSAERAESPRSGFRRPEFSQALHVRHILRAGHAQIKTHRSRYAAAENCGGDLRCPFEKCLRGESASNRPSRAAIAPPNIPPAT